jgi:hypothetical protein
LGIGGYFDYAPNDDTFPLSYYLWDDFRFEIVQEDEPITQKTVLATLGNGYTTESAVTIGDGPTAEADSRIRAQDAGGTWHNLTSDWDVGNGGTLSLSELRARESLRQRREQVETRTVTFQLRNGQDLHPHEIIEWDGALWDIGYMRRQAGGRNIGRVTVELRKLEDFGTNGIEYQYAQASEPTSPGTVNVIAGGVNDNGSGGDGTLDWDNVVDKPELVNTLNGRQGHTEVLESDVTGALGYNPQSEFLDETEVTGTAGEVVTAPDGSGGVQVGLPDAVDLQASLTLGGNALLQDKGAGVLGVFDGAGTNHGELVVSKLTVLDTIDSKSTNELKVDDQFLVFNKGQTGTSSLNGGIYGERAEGDVFWEWEEGRGRYGFRQDDPDDVGGLSSDLTGTTTSLPVSGGTKLDVVDGEELEVVSYDGTRYTVHVNTSTSGATVSAGADEIPVDDGAGNAANIEAESGDEIEKTGVAGTFYAAALLGKDESVTGTWDFPTIQFANKEASDLSLDGELLYDKSSGLYLNYDSGNAPGGNGPASIMDARNTGAGTNITIKGGRSDDNRATIRVQPQGSGSGLGADTVDGYHGADLAARSENETIPGAWEYTSEQTYRSGLVVDTGGGNDPLWVTRNGGKEEGLKAYATDQDLWLDYIEDDSESNPGTWHFQTSLEGGATTEWLTVGSDGTANFKRDVSVDGVATIGVLSYSGQSSFQSNSRFSGDGYTETPWLYTSFVEAAGERGGNSAGIAVGNASGWNHATSKDEIAHVVEGQTHLLTGQSGTILGGGSARPNARLDVRGDTKMYGNTYIRGTTDVTSGAAPLTVEEENGGDQLLLGGNEIEHPSGDLYLQNHTAHDTVLASGGGSVGVGARPDYRLDVRGGIATNDLIESYNYASGWTGSGFRFNDNGEGELSDLSVRETLLARELEVRKLSFSKGPFGVSPGAGTVSEAISGGTTANGNPEYDLVFEEPHGLAAGDYLLAQKFDPSSTQVISQSRLYVTAIESDKRVQVGVLEGTQAPQRGTEYIVAASEDSGRDSMLYMNPYGPHLDVLDGLSDFSDWESRHPNVRLGNLDGISSPEFGSMSGHGAYFEDNTYIGSRAEIGGLGASANIVSTGHTQKTSSGENRFWDEVIFSRLYCDFENGLNGWADTSSAGLTRDSSVSYKGGYSLKADNTSDGGVEAKYQLSGQDQIQELTFHYRETKNSSGGGLLLLDGNGNKALGFATDNPEWEITHSDGVTELTDDSGGSIGSEYTAWHRVHARFDWDAGQAVVSWENLEGPQQATRTFSLGGDGNGVGEIRYQSYNSSTWYASGSSIQMWIDEVEVIREGDTSRGLGPGDTITFQGEGRVSQELAAQDAHTRLYVRSRKPQGTDEDTVFLNFFSTSYERKTKQYTIPGNATEVVLQAFEQPFGNEVGGAQIRRVKAERGTHATSYSPPLGARGSTVINGANIKTGFIGDGTTKRLSESWVSLEDGTFGFAGGDLTWDGSTLAVTGTVTITGGNGISNLTDAGALATGDTMDDVPDGSTYERTTPDEVKGASRAFSGLDSAGDLVGLASPSKQVGTPSEDGLYLASDYLGFYETGAGEWLAYISGTDGSGQLAGGKITWNAEGGVAVEGSITVTGGTGFGSFSDADTSNIADGAGLGNTANWSQVADDNSYRPEDGATLGADLASNVTNADTGNLSDGAGLGDTALWGGVTGSAKPADNADVTGNNTSADTAAVNGTGASTVDSRASAGQGASDDLDGNAHFDRTADVVSGFEGEGALARQGSVDLATTEVTNTTADNITATSERQWAAEAGADVTGNNTASDVQTGTGKAVAEQGADVTGNNTAADIAGQGAFATLDEITSANSDTYIGSDAIVTDFIVADATLTNQLLANTATIKSTLTMGDGTTNGVIESNNFASGSSGFQLDGNSGHLEAQNADITGKVTANDGEIAGWNIKSGRIRKNDLHLRANAGGPSGATLQVDANNAGSGVEYVMVGDTYVGSSWTGYLGISAQDSGGNALFRLDGGSTEIAGWDFNEKRLTRGDLELGNLSGGGTGLEVDDGTTRTIFRQKNGDPQIYAHQSSGNHFFAGSGGPNVDSGDVGVNIAAGGNTVFHADSGGAYMGSLAVNDTITIGDGNGNGELQSKATDGEGPLIDIDSGGLATFRNIKAIGGELRTLDVLGTLTMGDGTTNGEITNPSRDFVTDKSGYEIGVHDQKRPDDNEFVPARSFSVAASNTTQGWLYGFADNEVTVEASNDLRLLSDGKTIIDSDDFELGTSASANVRVRGDRIKLEDLPTSDPGEGGMLYRSNGQVMISTGPEDPTADFSYTQGSSYNEYDFFDETDYPGGYSSVTWDFDHNDETSNEQNPKDHKFPTENEGDSSTYTVTLTATDGNNNTDSISKDVVVYNEPDEPGGPSGA